MLPKVKDLNGDGTTFEIKENGIDIVQMNLDLLKKVEELILYVIDQNSRIVQLQNELNKIKQTEIDIRESN